MSEKVNIRWATSEDASALAQIADDAGLTFQGGFTLDWSEPGMTWLVATDEQGTLDAAIQVMAGYPIGRMEMLMVRSDIGMKRRGVVVRDITDFAATILKAAGCQAVTSSISKDNESFLKVSEHRGWRVWSDANLIMKRLV